MNRATAHGQIMITAANLETKLQIKRLFVSLSILRTVFSRYWSLSVLMYLLMHSFRSFTCSFITCPHVLHVASFGLKLNEPVLRLLHRCSLHLLICLLSKSLLPQEPSGFHPRIRRVFLCSSACELTVRNSLSLDAVHTFWACHPHEKRQSVA